jgi:hypothetical protein
MAKDGITLATMWMPLAPSIEGDEFKNAGKRAFQQFSGGFDAENAGAAEGKRFADKWVGAFKGSFANADFGGFTKAYDTLNRLNQQVDAVASKKLGAQLPGLRQEYEKTTAEMYRLRDALHQIQVADEQAVAAGRGTMSMWVQRRKLEKEYEEAGNKAVSAQKEYNATLNEYEAVSAKAATASSLLGGAMGGAVVLGAQAVVGAFDDVIELGEHLFEGAVEATRRAGEALLDLGEKYEGLDHQVLEFSGATGDALTELQEHAAKVLGGLDVAGQDVGKTMAMLGSRLGTGASGALDQLTTTLTDLQGRFSDLKTADVATIFTDFGIGIDGANGALDTMVSNATAAGVSVGQLADGLKGPVAETLVALGMNLGQATHAEALFIQQGLPSSDVVRGLGSAMKIFKENNLSFNDGMREAGKELEAAKNSTDRDRLATELFGTKFVDAERIIGIFNSTLSQSPDAFDGAAGSSQHLIDSTETLQNQMMSVKNKLGTVFEPFAKSALSAVSGGLDHVGAWFNTHHDDIVRKIETWGFKFIDMLPKIKDFTVTAIHMLGPLGNMLKEMALTVLDIGAVFELFTGDVDGSNKLLGIEGNLRDNIDFGKMADTAADKVGQIFDKAIDKSHELKQSLQDAADAAMGIKIGPDGARTWWGTQLPAGPADGGPSYNGGGGSVSASPTDTSPHGPGVPGPSAPGGPPGPGAPPPAQPHTGVTQGKQPAPGHGGNAFAPSNFNWDAVAAPESSGNWQDPDSGHNGHYGGLQFSPSTWAEFGGLEFADRADHATKEQQITVANRTAFYGYNGTPPQGLGAWETIVKGQVPGVYASKGGEADPSSKNFMSKMLAKFGFGPKGTDTELAYYTPGEYVWDKETVDKHGPLIKALHGGGRYFAKGGPGGPAFEQVIWSDTETGQDIGENAGQWVGTPGSSDPGFYHRGHNDFPDHTGHVHTTVVADPFTGAPYNQVPAGSNITQGGAGFPDWVYRLGQEYGVVPSTYPGHQEWDGVNHGIDWWPADAKANMAGAGYTHEDHQTLTNFAETVGQSATGTQSPAGSGGSGVQLTDYHTSSGGGGGGSFPFGGGSPGGGGNPGFAGAPYGPGSPPPGGADVPVMPGEDWNEWVARSQRIGSAKKHQADLEDEHTKKLQDRAKIQDQLNADDQAELLHKMPADKRKELEDKRDQADKDISQIEQEQAKAAGDEKIDEYKAGEPKSGRGGKGSSMDSAAHSLGGSFLGGLSQSLGFPDIFGGKAPWDFGIVKMLGGVANWAVSGLQGGGRPSGMFGNAVDGAAQSTGFPSPFNLAARAPGPLAQAPGLPYAAPIIGAPPTAPGRAPGPPPAAGGTKQTPAGAPGSGIPPAPGQQPISFSKGLPRADGTSSSDQNFGKRWAPGFDGQPTPQGFPGAGLATELINTAFAAGGAALSAAKPGGAGGKPGSFQGGGGPIQMPGGGGGGSTPLGATGLAANQVAGTVSNFQGGDTHYHVDNSRTWNVSPKNDAGTVQHLREHDNSLRDNAALASAPGTLMSYP